MTAQNNSTEKKDRKKLDRLRHELHMMGELRTIKQILERIEKYGDRPCMVEKNRSNIIRHSVKDFREDVSALGTALLDLGLKGRHIAIVGENSYNWVVSFFAITCGVGVAVPVDRELKDEDICMLMSGGDADDVFFSKTYRCAVDMHFALCGGSKTAICLNKNFNEENILFIDDLISKGKELISAGDRRFTDAVVEKDDLAAIVFTSGTTGVNKGVMLTHGNFASNVDGVLESIAPEYSTLSLLPMNHVYELSCNILMSVYMNCVVYINGSFKNFSENVRIFKPDAFAVVPLVIESVYTSVWKTAEENGNADRLKKAVKISNFLLDHFGIDIRPHLFKDIAGLFGGKFPTMSCGGAALRAEYVKFLCDIGFNIYNGYGLTEASPIVTLNLDCRKRPECSGKAFPKTEFIIHEPDNNGVGEVWIRGENVSRGYYKDNGATAASFENGWFKTGDYGRTDENGRLYIVGRKKNLIILDNGKNVFPEEVECFFAERVEYVREAVVFEAEKMLNGRLQRIMAAAFYVDPLLFEGCTADDINKSVTEDIFSLNKLLPPYKRIQDMYVSTEEFELNSTGKIIRSKVTEKYYIILKQKGEQNND